MSTITLSTNKSFLTRKVLLGITPAQVLLIGITLFSLALHLVNLDAIGDANTYYTAAVESMLKSWNNFFFVAAEPGGSVTVDKPPLGLWIEAAFAFTFGVSGVVVSLPNIIAGVMSVPLLYYLVKKHWGELAGLVAGLVLAITPVVVATDRNNTMDGMLVFTLLLAAWAIIKSTESSKARWLFLGAFIVGLGFNIKMLQAFLPLPAFYSLYLLGSKTGWFRKIFNLGLATILLLIVSLSWVVIVDLTPADQRPFIGSSEDNTVMELVLGHNGLSRLFNPRAANSGPPQNAGKAPEGNSSVPLPRPIPGGQGSQPTAQGFQPPTAGTPFSQETGSPGIMRFFTAPLSKQMSWLLPFALVSMALIIFAARIRMPLEPEHQALVLWGGWLLICMVFFSSVEGIFHAYYVIMLALALGALVGGGFSWLWHWHGKCWWLSGLLVLAALITIAFQIFTAFQYGVQSAWVYLPILLLIGGVGMLLLKGLRSAAFLSILVSMLIIPMIWTLLTVLDPNPAVNLPTAYSGSQQDLLRPTPVLKEPHQVNEKLVTYLQANTQDVEYLVAVPAAHIGSPLLLETGRPVLYMGGFSGGDPVISTAGLSEMVAMGELRYVMITGGNGNQREISDWVVSFCEIVPEFSQGNANPNQVQKRPNKGHQRPGNQAAILFQCE